jgi:hypothetical protein
MNTFLPYADFVQSVRSLDKSRLNKQRSECTQIFAALDNPKGAYGHHPAVLMWTAYQYALAHYALMVCDECD